MRTLTGCSLRIALSGFWQREWAQIADVHCTDSISSPTGTHRRTLHFTVDPWLTKKVSVVQQATSAASVAQLIELSWQNSSRCKVEQQAPWQLPALLQPA
jgi:hypothetical protein